MIWPFLSVAGRRRHPAENEKKLPEFRPRWWFKPHRLDIRPVAWSLDNHPEEWRINGHRQSNGEPYVIVHTPSEHAFWVASGVGYYILHNADCSRSGRTFQSFQQRIFHRAYRRWLSKMTPIDNLNIQFAAHFIHK